jgi:NlpC/P60 family putative phage cell wall peptidase
MSAVVTAARRWLGTPYVHQASLRGAGSDCLGLVRGVWRELLGAEPVVPPPYTADWSEPQRRETLWEAARAHLREVSPERAMRPGEVLLFRMRRRGVAKHLGILGTVGSGPTFIHAYSGCGVVESPLAAPWRGRIVARFEFPLEEA